MRDGVDITERVAGGGRLRAAGGAPQERHDLGAGAGLVRGEGGAGRAVGDVLADGPLDGVVEVVGGLDVDEVHRLADLDGHGAGELAGAGAGRAVAGVDGERDVDGLAGLGVAAGKERDVAERVLAGGGAVVELVSRLDGAAVVVAAVVGVERALVDGRDGALVKGHVVDGVVAAVALGGAQVAEEIALVEADAVALRDGVLDVLAHEVDDDAAGVRHGRAAARGGAGIAGRVQGEVQRDGLRGGLGVGDERHAIEVGDLGAGVERAGGIAGGHGGAAIVQRALRGGGQGEGHVIEGDIGIGLGLAGVAAGLSDLVHEVVEVALRELDGLTGHTVVVDVVVLLVDADGAAVEPIVGALRHDIQRALAIDEVGVGQGIEIGSGSGGIVFLAAAVVPVDRLGVHTGNIVIPCAGGNLNVIAIGVAVSRDRLGILVGIGGRAGRYGNVKRNAVGLGNVRIGNAGDHGGGELCSADAGEICLEVEIAGAAGGIVVRSSARADTVGGGGGNLRDAAEGIDGLVGVGGAVGLVDGGLRGVNKITVAVVHRSAVLNSTEGRLDQGAGNGDGLHIILALIGRRCGDGGRAACSERYDRRGGRLVRHSCDVGVGGNKGVGRSDRGSGRSGGIHKVRRQSRGLTDLRQRNACGDDSEGIGVGKALDRDGVTRLSELIALACLAVNRVVGCSGDRPDEGLARADRKLFTVTDLVEPRIGGGVAETGGGGGERGLAAGDDLSKACRCGHGGGGGVDRHISRQRGILDAHGQLSARVSGLLALGIIDHIAGCGGRPLVVGGIDLFFIKKGDVDRAVRHRIGSAVEGDGGDVAREKLVIDSDCRGKSDDLLRNDSAADDRLDGAGGVKRSGRHRGDLCAQTVALRGGAGPGIVKAVVGFAVERGCSTALGLGDTKARCVQRKRNLGAPINGSRSGCANRCFAGYGIAIRRRVRPCRHDDEAQDQCQSQ